VRHTQRLRSLMDLLTHVFVRLGNRLDLAGAHEGRVVAVGFEVFAELQVSLVSRPSQTNRSCHLFVLSRHPIVVEGADEEEGDERGQDGKTTGHPEGTRDAQLRAPRSELVGYAGKCVRAERGKGKGD
jgi:hypothetical protein